LNYVQRFRFSSKSFGQIRNHFGPREGPGICLQICGYDILTCCPKLVSIQIWQFLAKIWFFCGLRQKNLPQFLKTKPLWRDLDLICFYFLIAQCSVVTYILLHWKAAESEIFDLDFISTQVWTKNSSGSSIKLNFVFNFHQKNKKGFKLSHFSFLQITQFH